MFWGYQAENKSANCKKPEQTARVKRPTWLYAGGKGKSLSKGLN
jgi:hypothetical protein